MPSRLCPAAEAGKTPFALARPRRYQGGMDERPGIVVTGASGRMGRTLIRLVAATESLHLVAALERRGHEWVGRDAGEAAGIAPLGVGITDDAVEAVAAARAIVDFTSPAASLEYVALAAQARACHVIGTTGFGAGDLSRIAAAARHATIIRAGNMSLGVTLLASLTERVAEALGPEWDVEIVEAHHRHKIDAPSGTALLLGAAVAEGRGVSLDDVAERGRDGVHGARQVGAIGFSSIRGGDIVGEHDVIFAGQGERVVLRHVATDRDIFARGALRAVLWGLDQGPGEYDMRHVLDLS
jgi:4-hydroxy-tetrahydrodipicolinate reductase